MHNYCIVVTANSDFVTSLVDEANGPQWLHTNWPSSPLDRLSLATTTKDGHKLTCINNTRTRVSNRPTDQKIQRLSIKLCKLRGGLNSIVRKKN